VAAATVLAVLAVAVPCYMLAARALRRHAGCGCASPRVSHQLLEFDVGVAGYVVGFAANVVLTTAVLGLLFGGSLSFAFLFFLVVLRLATKILHVLEAAAASCTAAGSEHRAVARAGIEVLERSLGVAVGFAWLAQFRSVYNSVVFAAFGKAFPEEDDATWLEVHESSEEEEVRSGLFSL
jgi:hypothetical protein